MNEKKKKMFVLGYLSELPLNSDVNTSDLADDIVSALEDTSSYKERQKIVLGFFSEHFEDFDKDKRVAVAVSVDIAHSSARW